MSTHNMFSCALNLSTQQMTFNTKQAVGKFSRQQIGDIFSCFPRKKGWNFMQIVSLGK